jgi:hypothetical protein
VDRDSHDMSRITPLGDEYLPEPRSHVACRSCHILYRLPNVERGNASQDHAQVRDLRLGQRDRLYPRQRQSHVPEPDRGRKLPTGRSECEAEGKGKGSTHVRILLDFISLSWNPTCKKKILTLHCLDKHYLGPLDAGGAILGIGERASYGSRRK